MDLHEELLMGCPSMVRQPFCALPWCGRSDLHIDEHHVVPRSQGGEKGPTVFICHECHMKHHDGRGPKLYFSYMSSVPFENTDKWHVSTDDNPIPVELVVYDETADAPGDKEVEELLGELANDIREFKGTSDTLDYYLGQLLASADVRVGDRKALGEWCADNFDISPKAVGSWLSKRIAYGRLPNMKGVAELGITNGYLMVRVLKKNPDALLDAVLADFRSMPKEQFVRTYNMSDGESKVRTCPWCGHEL